MNTKMVSTSRPFATILAYGQIGVSGQNFNMAKEPQSPLFRARLARELSRPQLAELAGTSPQQIERLEKGMREMTRTWADRLAPHLGVSPEFLVFSRARQIPIIGYASAGSGEMHFDSEQHVIGKIDAPDWANDNTVAVTVRGTSLGRLLDGWAALYDDRRDPPDDSLIGALCVVQIEGGGVFIKRLRKGSAANLFHLESATEATLFDQPIAWAAKVRELRPA
jgi:transcriptional regulator with XRE-family HTH domain